jgi:hypothetical protein
MNQKDQLLHWGVRVLKVAYPLAILCALYVALMMVTSGISLWYTLTMLSNMPK